jgi:hypothetical protein
MYIGCANRCSLEPLYDMYTYDTVSFTRFRGRAAVDLCHSSCYWSSFLDCASLLALSILLLIDIFSTSSPASFKPSTCPMSPPGLGTGHSLFGFSFSSSCVFLILSSLMMSLHVSSSGDLRRRRLLFWPVGSGESASVRGSTGQGMMCGAATTRKETMRVVVKSEVVMRDRGCRWGGIVCPQFEVVESYWRYRRGITGRQACQYAFSLQARSAYQSN